MFLISAAVWVLLCGSVGSGAEVHWKADDCTGREVNMTEANMGRVVEFYEWCLGLAAGLPDTGRRHKFGRVTASRLKGAVKRFANSSSLPPERLASVREQFGHLYFLLKDAGLPVAARRRKTFTRTSFHLPSTCSPSTTPCDRHAFRRPKFLKFCFFKRLCPSLTVCLLYIFLFVLIVALVIVVCIKLRRKKKCDSLDSSG
ncbi:hypothetical protein AAG570_012394 [Ranatra chinensis]|uniref:Uncharacterized protein n=1 Tax=Ranatra chinensis TaxID=642074 RepID=A0ABD0YUY6_9HEMI